MIKIIEKEISELVPYENKRGMQDTIDALSLIKKGMKVGIYIGAEGGFDHPRHKLR